LKMFGVQGAESFQAEYQKLIDTWMRRFTEIEYSLNRNQSKPNQEKGQEIEKEPVKLNDIKIWDSDGNILYEKGKTYDITPDFIQKIEEASELSPSDKLEELPSLTVEVDGETFFKSENGEVSVNKRSTLEQEAGVQGAGGKEEEISLADKSPAEEEALEYREGEPGDLSSYSSSFRSREEEISDPTTDILVELMAPIIEAMPVIEPELEQHSEPSLIDFLEPELDSQGLEASKELSSTAPSVPDVEQQDGLSALQSAIGEMKPAVLKDVLHGMATDMEASAQEQEPQPDIEALVKSRLEERQNPHWWDKVSTKVETMVSRVRDTFTQHRAASTLKDFTAGMGLQPGESYQGAEYNISREGKDYTLTDKQGNELMKFQSSPMGVKVDKSLPALDFSHYQKTEQLRQDLKEARQPSGAFISEGAAEGQNLQRINALTQALSQYAAKNGGAANVEGKFSYDWQANGSGSVIIQDKKGSVLLAAGQGHTRSRMSEKDLQHFEQMLPALASQQSRPPQAQVAAAARGKQLER
jgi:hypothetical protein